MGKSLTLDLTDEYWNGTRKAALGSQPLWRMPCDLYE
jgi:hypothetical protein